MGNSGSMNGLPGYEDAYHHTQYHHQHHQQQRYHEMLRNGGHHMAQPGWLESYQRDLRNGGGGHRTFDNRHNHEPLGHRESTSSGPSLPPPMKVLPDIPGRVAKLRPTNNGNILHSGGTISKNNNLQRSKSISSPTYQQHQKQSFDEGAENGLLNSLPPQMLMTRSRTQVNMMLPSGRREFDGSPLRSRGFVANQKKPSYDHGTLNSKRFGSEPDLRISTGKSELQDDSTAGGAAQAHRNSKPAQSKIIKGKNKKKAPVPPVLDKREPEVVEKQRIIAYSPLRKTNSDASSTLPSSDSNSNNPSRKLRLFKTRAETKKNLNITKLPEASDAKYSSKSNAQNNTPIKMRVSPTNSSTYKTPERRETNFSIGTLDKPKSRLNPTSFFRREKTFDIGVLERDRILRAEHVPEIKPTMSPPISRRKSIVKSLLEKDNAHQLQQQLQHQQLDRAASAESKYKLKLQEDKRKQSQQSAHAPAMTDFQKELQLATRKKSTADPKVTQPPPKAPLGHRKSTEAKQSTKAADQPQVNSIIISVEPKMESEREVHSQSPPPIPPPLPKSSFYFGMSTPQATEKDPSKISPIILHKAMMIETRVDSDPNSSEDEQSPIQNNYRDIINESEMDKTQLDVIDRFAASLLNGSKFQPSGSDSAASSEVDIRTNSGDIETEGQEISLKLRPTLPRKQFDIPRFSPAAAWRLLTTEDDFGRDSTELFPFTEKKTVLRSLETVDAAAEDRIERIYREPIPGLQDNKSGDSGISGDAGLPDIGEAQMTSSKERDSPESSPVDDNNSGNNGWSSNAIRLTPWTPQQDLEDDDDTTGSCDNRQLMEETPLSGGPNDFSSKGHLFSLSLPRESHLTIYPGNGNAEKVEKHMFNSLQKLRKSVSDAFTSDADVSPLESGDNWFLSRLDTPTIITNTYEKRQLSPATPKQSPPETPPNGSKKDELGKPAKHSAITYVVSGKHMMYLPKEATKVITTGKNDQNNNVPEMSTTVTTVKSHSEKRKETKENMQDPVPDPGESFPVKISHRKNHRFTFQSTIRQIEKRRVAEKLSREAEIKEAMRLSELEAMRRVEEEFQKKRAREKASIRHQLRLFTMEETGQQYDGNEEDENAEITKRTEMEAEDTIQLPKSNGLYRKKESTLERSSYMHGQARRLGHSRFNGNGTVTLERKFSNGNLINDHHEEDFNSDDEENTGNNNHNSNNNNDDDDDVDSSLGYIDTRTPYISRIIQAKSSKSYGGLKK
ncbi:uncharacterized protein LOC131426144 isoform X2 [Malaya genurostris]|uniref:uncharacterized protein LOC131426144 isoform X2 n=1 Tax=Malaya genurostris TaxID=325434 RepID=UPI0026F3AA76|nr:uncharacterized protein LOC131426144 isoform X2 [Malaya genurostris]